MTNDVAVGEVMETTTATQQPQTQGKTPAAAESSMKLYVKVDRIHAELRALGFGDDCALTVEDLTPFDNYHYLGTEGCDEAVAALGVTADSRVLEIGSGIGGPARYVANRTGCKMTALELLPDLNSTAASLTARCGGSLKGEVTHICGDVLDGAMKGLAFDGIISILCFLHIQDRARLFSECRAALLPAGTKPGDGGAGAPRRMYIEDFVLLREPTASQSADLKTKVLCPYLPTKEEYSAQLEAAGFGSIDITDVTAPWTTFTSERLAAFRDRREVHLGLHGESVTQGLEDFYTFVSQMFTEGVIGGVRIVATLVE
ncbi:unnamed protein product [Pylaiella littoralis]